MAEVISLLHGKCQCSEAHRWGRVNDRQRKNCFGESMVRETRHSAEHLRLLCTVISDFLRHETERENWCATVIASDMRDMHPWIIKDSNDSSALLQASGELLPPAKRDQSSAFIIGNEFTDMSTMCAQRANQNTGEAQLMKDKLLIGTSIVHLLSSTFATVLRVEASNNRSK
jgi:hypothetical protein